MAHAAVPAKCLGCVGGKKAAAMPAGRKRALFRSKFFHTLYITLTFTRIHKTLNIDKK
jgi:hypothetical protein